MFTGRADAEDGAPVLWPSDAKNEFIGKDPDAGKVMKVKVTSLSCVQLLAMSNSLRPHGL